MRGRGWLLSLLGGLLLCTACGDDDDPTGPGDAALSSRAYKGHANDIDMNHLAAVYPDLVGTRLDDCQSCHTGGAVTSGDRTRFRNACDYCHLIPFPDDEVTGAPGTYAQTLNPYGQAYVAAGRDAAALRAIADLDSDGDGAANEAEIEDLRYPGSADSRPGQPRAKLTVLDLDDLATLSMHSQFLLANSHKQQFDAYATYTGVTIADLLTSQGVDLGAISGITVVAADGYMKDFDIDQVVSAFPPAQFHSGLDTGTRGADCGFVEYPADLPDGLVDGGTVPGPQWLMLAWERDGGPMDASYLDPVSGKIDGEGPLRIVVPQATPGAPDRGSRYSPSNCDDGYDYDDAKDHNAGAMVRGVVAIRANPMPEGVEAFDHLNGGWAYVDAGQVVLYGQGIQ